MSSSNPTPSSRLGDTGESPSCDGTALDRFELSHFAAGPRGSNEIPPRLSLDCHRNTFRVASTSARGTDRAKVSQCVTLADQFDLLQCDEPASGTSASRCVASSPLSPDWPFSQASPAAASSCLTGGPSQPVVSCPSQQYSVVHFPAPPPVPSMVSPAAAPSLASADACGSGTMPSTSYLDLPPAPTSDVADAHEGHCARGAPSQRPLDGFDLAMVLAEFRARRWDPRSPDELRQQEQDEQRRTKARLARRKQRERKRQMQERLDVTRSSPGRPADHNADPSVRADQSAPSLSASAGVSTAMDIRSASTASRRPQGGVPLTGFGPSLERDTPGGSDYSTSPLAGRWSGPCELNDWSAAAAPSLSGFSSQGIAQWPLLDGLNGFDHSLSSCAPLETGLPQVSPFDQRSAESTTGYIPQRDFWAYDSSGADRGMGPLSHGVGHLPGVPCKGGHTYNPVEATFPQVAIRTTYSLALSPGLTNFQDNMGSGPLPTPTPSDQSFQGRSLSRREKNTFSSRRSRARKAANKVAHQREQAEDKEKFDVSR